MLKILGLILMLSVVAIAVPASAAPGPAVGDCELYRHDTVTAVIGVVALGDHEAWAAQPGCGIARSSTQVMRFVGQYSGPVFLAATTIVWQVVPFVGCTISAFTTQNNLGAAGSSSITTATITMTSNECHGAIQVTVSVGGGAYVWPALFEINIRVEQPNYMFLCAAAEGVANAYSPTSTACQEPQLNLLTFSCASTRATPDSFSETATGCDSIIAILFPVVLFILLVVWAEYNRGRWTAEDEKMPTMWIYIIAMIVGGSIIIGLWSELAGLRPTLLAVVIMVAWRTLQFHKLEE